jgi:hypothetical protein
MAAMAFDLCLERRGNWHGISGSAGMAHVTARKSTGVAGKEIEMSDLWAEQAQRGKLNL